jgi:para-aminobenzoate synthetase/4-amino-4-deoxychorismate lyase
VLLELRGQIQIEISEFEEPKERFICFSSKKTFSKDRLLYHKTSYRPLYRSEYSKIENKKYLDLIFRNERDEITEGARSNIIIKDKNDSFFTPPLSSGLLNGVYRQYFLKVSKNAKEKILTRDSLLNAKKIYLCNSLFGLKEVSLEERS